MRYLNRREAHKIVKTMVYKVRTTVMVVFMTIRSISREQQLVVALHSTHVNGKPGLDIIIGTPSCNWALILGHVRVYPHPHALAPHPPPPHTALSP